MYLYRVCLFVCVFALLLSSCQSSGEDVPSEQQSAIPEPVSQSSSEGLILIDRAQIEVAGIRWGQTNSQEIPDGQRLFGEWVLHPEYTAEVHSITNGRVDRILYSVNQQVGKGAGLIVVESPELIDLQREYLEKMERATFLRQELDRMKTLQEGGATALKNLQIAESEFNSNQAGLAGLKADLALYGLQAEHVQVSTLSSKYTIRAPQSGQVVQSEVAIGQWLEPGAGICQIRDRQKMHADLFLFPAQNEDLQRGQILQLELPTPDMEAVNVKVLSLDNRIDPEKKAIRVHTIVQGKMPLHAVEGGFLSARFDWAGEEELLYMPASAVRREGNEEYIFVLDSEASTPTSVAFRKVPVRVIRRDSRQVALERGSFNGKEAFVLEGAYYVDAQSKVEEFAEEE